MATGKTTQDRNEIQKWAEARGAKPGVVASTESENQTGILRLMFPDAPNANDGALEEISWEEFFEKFEASGLEFTYQEETADGEKSNFNKLTYPEEGSTNAKKITRKAGQSSSQKSAAKKTAGKTAAKKATSTKAAKKAPAKKGAAKKSAAKKVPTKGGAKKAVVKKTPAKKSAAKKSAAKRSSATRTASKKGKR